jgi:hypothetical protein
MLPSARCPDRNIKRDIRQCTDSLSTVIESDKNLRSLPRRLADTGSTSPGI